MHRYCITSIPLIDANGVNAVYVPPPIVSFLGLQIQQHTWPRWRSI